MSYKTTTKELFKKIEKLTKEIIVWNDTHIDKRAAIIMAGEETIDGKGVVRQAILGGHPKILGHLLFDATIKSPDTMIPLLRMVADAAEDHLKRKKDE